MWAKEDENLYGRFNADGICSINLTIKKGMQMPNEIDHNKT